MVIRNFLSTLKAFFKWSFVYPPELPKCTCSFWILKPLFAERELPMPYTRAGSHSQLLSKVSCANKVFVADQISALREYTVVQWKNAVFIIHKLMDKVTLCHSWTQALCWKCPLYCVALHKVNSGTDILFTVYYYPCFHNIDILIMTIHPKVLKKQTWGLTQARRLFFFGFLCMSMCRIFTS